MVFEDYLKGIYEDDLRKVLEYEAEQFKKAFSKGTERGWAAYRRNVVRRVDAFNKKYKIGLDSDVIMSGEARGV